MYDIVNPVVCDTECYRNYWLIKFKCLTTGFVWGYDMFTPARLDIEGVKRSLEGKTIITFNGNAYDKLLIQSALAGYTPSQLKDISDEIIQTRTPTWHIAKRLNLPEFKLDHVDLMDVSPGRYSLKAYGGKMHSKTIQDLPIAHDAILTRQQADDTSLYCENDLQTTEDLFNKMKNSVELRIKMSNQYDIDLRSKSDAQIAEAIVKKLCEAKLNRRIYAPKIEDRFTFKIPVPEHVSFELPETKRLLSDVKLCDFVAINGIIRVPEVLQQPLRTKMVPRGVQIGSMTYAVGIGGMHSTESAVSYEASDEWMIVDRDVASYYPNIILGSKSYPKALGEIFLVIYKDIVERRLEAKHNGDTDTANILKTAVNGIFGKLGSPYSILYAPELLIQTTLAGQLSILMLIEMLYRNEFEVISANTDGLVSFIKRSRYAEFLSIINLWEQVTGYETEETLYNLLCSRDVNSYVAIKPDGKVKLKGCFAEPEPVASSWPNPTGAICTKAFIKYIRDGIPVAYTLRASNDIRDFIFTRNITGGGNKVSATGEVEAYCGRVARWYYGSGETGYLAASVSGNKVATSDGAKLCMTLPDEFVKDIDYDKYERIVNSYIKDTGYDNRTISL
jgi:hypothetical protein